MDKCVFPTLLKQVVDGVAFSRKNAVSANEACGIYPLNRDKITGDKLSTAMPLTHAASHDDPVSPSTSESPGDELKQKQMSMCHSIPQSSEAKLIN